MAGIVLSIRQTTERLELHEFDRDFSICLAHWFRPKVMSCVIPSTNSSTC